MHLIIGEGSGRVVLEQTIHFELEKDWYMSFADDVVDSKVLRFFDMLVLGCYLIVL